MTQTLKEWLKEALEADHTDYDTVAEAFMHQDEWYERSYEEGSYRAKGGENYNGLDTYWVFKNANVTAKEIESYGGEDCGSTYYSVYKFTRGDEEEIVRFDGWYASHYGTDFQDYKFVRPVEKTVIEYE